MEAVSIDEPDVGDCEGWQDQNPECHMHKRNRQRRKSWERDGKAEGKTRRATPVEVEGRDVFKETKSTADQRSTRKMTGEWSLDLVTAASLKWWNWRLQVFPILSANHIPCVFSSHFQTSSPCKHQTPSFLLYAYKMHIKEYMHISLCMHTYIYKIHECMFF